MSRPTENEKKRKQKHNKKKWKETQVKKKAKNQKKIKKTKKTSKKQFFKISKSKKNQKNKTMTKSKTKKIKKSKESQRKKEGLQGATSRDGSNKWFFTRICERNRAAIEVKKRKKEKTKKNWTLKVAVRPSGVLLVGIIFAFHFFFVRCACYFWFIELFYLFFTFLCPSYFVVTFLKKTDFCSLFFFL